MSVSRIPVRRPWREKERARLTGKLLVVEDLFFGYRIGWVVYLQWSICLHHLSQKIRRLSCRHFGSCASEGVDVGLEELLEVPLSEEDPVDECFQHTDIGGRCWIGREGLPVGSHATDALQMSTTISACSFVFESARRAIMIQATTVVFWLHGRVNGGLCT